MHNFKSAKMIKIYTCNGPLILFKQIENRQIKNQLVISTSTHIFDYSVIENEPTLAGDIVDYSQNSCKT